MPRLLFTWSFGLGAAFALLWLLTALRWRRLTEPYYGKSLDSPTTARFLADGNRIAFLMFATIVCGTVALVTGVRLLCGNWPLTGHIVLGVPALIGVGLFPFAAKAKSDSAIMWTMTVGVVCGILWLVPGSWFVAAGRWELFLSLILGVPGGFILLSAIVGAAAGHDIPGEPMAIGVLLVLFATAIYAGVLGWIWQNLRML